jgi:hypothetical protein
MSGMSVEALERIHAFRERLRGRAKHRLPAYTNRESSAHPSPRAGRDSWCQRSETTPYREGNVAIERQQELRRVVKTSRVLGTKLKRRTKKREPMIGSSVEATNASSRARYPQVPTRSESVATNTSQEKMYLTLS